MAFSGHKIDVVYRDDEFTMTGPPLLHNELVRMTCRYRGDGGPARFIVQGTVIPATVQNLSSHELEGLTCVKVNDVEVQQVEHILSALYGMDVLDTDIFLEWVDGPRPGPIAPPVAQLNSREFALAIASCVLSRRNAPVTKVQSLDKSYVFSESEAECSNGDPARAIFTPLHKLHITTQINFPYFWGHQIYSLTLTSLDYMKSVCWARSFFRAPYPHRSEWEQLRLKYPSVLREIENHYRSFMLDFDDKKWITPLVVNTEPVRHKTLDLIGELALLGVRINAGVYVYKPSHRFNRDCMKRLYDSIQFHQEEP